MGLARGGGGRSPCGRASVAVQALWASAPRPPCGGRADGGPSHRGCAWQQRLILCVSCTRACTCLQVGLGNPLPPGVPKQLRVGQRVLARHKPTRQVHDGTVLTIQVCAGRMRCCVRMHS